MDRKIRVIVVDDSALVRSLLSEIINRQHDMECIGSANDPLIAREMIREMNPDVITLDVEMPRMDGITATQAIRARFPGVRVLIVTTFGRPGYLQRALDAGATGFMVKDAPVEPLADGVRTVAAGGRAIDQSLALEALSAGSSPLTEREADVLREVEGGGTIADIARSLGLSQGTVRNHVSSSMLKMDARTRAEAASLARAAGWL